MKTLLLNNPEELERKVAARKQFDADRKARIFDKKTRTIGVEVDKLEHQIEEKRIALEREKEYDKTWDQTLVNNEIVCEAIDRYNRRAHAEKVCNFVQENAQNHGKETRKEWFLSDPNYQKSEKPARHAENEHELGVSSLQIFEGEDLLNKKTKKENQAHVAEWLKTQMEENMMKKERENEEEKQYAQASQQANDLRAGIEKIEQMRRRAGEEKGKEENLTQAEQHKNRAQRAKDRDESMRLAHVAHCMQDPFLGETAGAKTAADFKGMPTKEKQAIYDTIALQTREHVEMEQREKEYEEFHADREKMNTLFREQIEAKQRSNIRDARLALDSENEVLKKEHADKMHQERRTYAGRLDEEPYFSQFGTSHR